MSLLLDQALERLRELPETNQDLAAVELMSIVNQFVGRRSRYGGSGSPARKEKPEDADDGRVRCLPRTPGDMTLVIREETADDLDGIFDWIAENKREFGRQGRTRIARAAAAA